MSQIHKHSIPANIADSCLINPEQYKAQYHQSVTDPDAYWGEQGKILDWIRPYTRVKNTSFAPGNVSIKWYEDGTLNLAANCLDRHLAERGDQTAIIWEGDDASQSKKITYRELHRDVCRFANALLGLGIKKGDVVAIYMPMVPEAAVAMLACARIGAIHSVIFGGFSPEAVAGRIIDSSSRLVITADEGLRAGRAIPLKKNVDDALKNPNVTSIENVVVLKRTGGKTEWHEGRDLWWSDLLEKRQRPAPAGRDERRRPAVYPLYLRLNRQAERRPAHHRGLPGVCGNDLQIRIRLFILAISTGAPPTWAG
ncbi:Acetyl-coenzyme A synthetase [Raoultella terrigena]|uniref:Acetyl-coenzyme A synthetase n=1 Tax=Raoultella terrigena TaxID=577 RepID=A0A3P8K4W7_RAOTE|nr:Acetyl-coenzyme A synthetase [Raoultella terrigena]